VWLNYKNAYEYWTEQRLALNKEVQVATQQLFLKLPLSGLQQSSATSSTASEHGTLFLQLTVVDLGICLPMNQLTQVKNKIGHMYFQSIALSNCYSTVGIVIFSSVWFSLVS
jgi:hypothetical protein